MGVTVSVGVAIVCSLPMSLCGHVVGVGVVGAAKIIAKIITR